MKNDTPPRPHKNPGEKQARLKIIEERNNKDKSKHQLNMKDKTQ